MISEGNGSARYTGWNTVEFEDFGVGGVVTSATATGAVGESAGEKDYAIFRGRYFAYYFYHGDNE